MYMYENPKAFRERRRSFPNHVETETRPNYQAHLDKKTDLSPLRSVCSTLRLYSFSSEKWERDGS